MAELILALDLPNKEQALSLIDSLGGKLSWCKVGMELFTGSGPDLIAELKKRQLSVFLDLKFHDIPHTVGRAVAQAARIGADLVTVHCQGGARMLQEACAVKERPRIFGVTVLTSMAQGEIPGVSANPNDFALDLATLAATAGLDGIVCSVQEVAAIKKRHPNLRVLCPGIRPTWAEKKGTADDQRRTATPQKAVALGADFLVVGRPVLCADNPREALEKILDEMASS
ncbi:MAG: orotidine-5'-phosphate decarboxylase [Desulfovibrionaceae bacterium]|nr:orotidine-5'-phosphate decarboxylase [Desulfovibrionaceae bacterium]